jgi:cell division transport system ATP-binding protein
MIQFEQVTKSYFSGTALKNVSFNLAEGEMAFLTGHSGAGKSTILKLIALMERPTEGVIKVEGHALNTLSDAHIPYLRRQMGVVFQNPRLLFDRTVFNNVALPLVILGMPEKEIGRRVRAALDKVGLLDKEKLSPITLSSGEQQRVGIARAVVHKPRLLLADEPTGNLDPELSWEIMRLFEQFNQVGTSLLIATHDMGLVSRLPYRQLQLNKGILYEQTP